jgi:hypothetical protein
MRKGFLYLFSLVQMTMAGCVYVKKDKISPVCHLPATASFAAHVQPILRNNCYACHSSSSNVAGILLESFNEVTPYARNGAMLGTITHASGYIPMPKGAPRLDDCSIAVIKKWIDNGAPNN